MTGAWNQGCALTTKILSGSIIVSMDSTEYLLSYCQSYNSPINMQTLWCHHFDCCCCFQWASTLEGYHEYIVGCSVHRRDTMSTSGEYHEYIGGISCLHWGMFSTSGDVQCIGDFNRNWKDFIKLLTHMYHDIPPMYWTSPDVLLVSPTFIMISPMYSWYPPNVLMIFPRCTEHPLMYRTSPNVLNTHYTGCKWCSFMFFIHFHAGK